jgi:hypothetical protein
MQVIADASASMRSKLKGSHHSRKQRAGAMLKRGAAPVGIGISGIVLVVFLSVFIYRRVT